ncbi:MAG: hypothetical protein ACE5J5_05110 [Candidatus Hydrothermarchaeales archaeon]
MLPEDFVEYAKRFEVGFLTTVKDEKPDIKVVSFEVKKDKIIVKDGDLPEEDVSLVFSNSHYTEEAEMVQIQGVLKKDDEGYQLVAEKIFWTLPFDLDKKSDVIIKRWRRG